MANDEIENPEEVIDEYIVETTGVLRLLELGELIIATTYLNMRSQLFSDEELIRMFSKSMHASESSKTSLVSMFMEAYKDKLDSIENIDDSNVDEAIRHLRQDRSKAISMARRS